MCKRFILDHSSNTAIEVDSGPGESRQSNRYFPYQLPNRTEQYSVWSFCYDYLNFMNTFLFAAQFIINNKHCDVQLCQGTASTLLGFFHFPLARRCQWARRKREGAAKSAPSASRFVIINDNLLNIQCGKVHKLFIILLGLSSKKRYKTNQIMRLVSCFARAQSMAPSICIDHQN